MAALRTEGGAAAAGGVAAAGPPAGSDPSGLRDIGCELLRDRAERSQSADAISERLPARARLLPEYGAHRPPGVLRHPPEDIAARARAGSPHAQLCVHAPGHPQAALLHARGQALLVRLPALLRSPGARLRLQCSRLPRLPPGVVARPGATQSGRQLGVSTDFDLGYLLKIIIF